MTYRFLEDIATADVAFEAEGKTLEELFSSGAQALEEVQVSTPGVEERLSETIKLESTSPDNLLFDFLNELVFLKDAKQLVFSKFNIKIYRDKDVWRLEAAANGETLNPQKHELRTDVKAVTKHKFGIKKTDGGYKATVVLDV